MVIIDTEYSKYNQQHPQRGPSHNKRENEMWHALERQEPSSKTKHSIFVCTDLLQQMLITKIPIIEGTRTGAQVKTVKKARGRREKRLGEAWVWNSELTKGVGKVTIARVNSAILDCEERLLMVRRLLLLLLLLLWSERIEAALRLLHTCLLCGELSVF
jgi:hypothetical protein